MGRPIIREGIRFKPLAAGQLPGPKTFNPVQAVAEGLANMRVVRSDQPDALHLTGRNSILNLKDAGLDATAGRVRGPWTVGVEYNPGDIIVNMENIASFLLDPPYEPDWFWLTAWVWPRALKPGGTPFPSYIQPGVMATVTLPDANYDLDGTGTIIVSPNSGGLASSWVLLSVSAVPRPESAEFPATGNQPFPGTGLTVKIRGGIITDVS